MKVAAYQAPLLPCGSMEAIERIRERVKWCEAAGIAILCCPEAVLGGLADNAPRPADIAIEVQGGGLEAVLAPLASETVTTIVGFTERSGADRLYNAAAVYHRGTVARVYRKLHPAIRKSVYHAGNRMPVFRVEGLTFGIILCNDSNFAEPARAMAGQGATVLFIPSNNALPPEKADVVTDARNVDVALATANGMWVVRADVAGRADGLLSHGSSGIIHPDGRVLRSAQPFMEDLLVADLDAPR